MSRILIVEDDAAMCELFREHLADSYQILETADASEALALALEHKPDCFLLDLMLPHLSGFELCQTFASLSATRLTPILVITGQPADRYKEYCMNLGAWDYLQKPVNFVQLKARLALLVETRPKDRRSEVRVRLRVALKLRGVDINGKKFELPTVTDDMSASGFLCGCTASLAKDAIVEVFLGTEGDRYAGRARFVRTEWQGAPWQRCAFQFIERPLQWVLH